MWMDITVTLYASGKIHRLESHFIQLHNNLCWPWESGKRIRVRQRRGWKVREAGDEDDEDEFNPHPASDLIPLSLSLYTYTNG